METRWVFDTSSNRYRDTVTGRFIAPERATELRDGYIAGRQQNMTDMVTRTWSGADPRKDSSGYFRQLDALNEQGWKRIETTLVTEYMYGRGGINAMTEQDWRTLGSLVDRQRSYWDGFMGDLRYNPKDVDYVANRANMYHAESRAFYEHGRADAWAIDLPEYPGEQTCLANCHCAWDILKNGEEIWATWSLGGSNNCKACARHAEEYDPLIFRHPEADHDWNVRSDRDSLSEYREHDKEMTDSEWNDPQAKYLWGQYKEASFRNVNGTLRGREGYDTSPEVIEVMKGALELKKTGGDTMVYRGVRRYEGSDVWENLAPGAVIRDKGFVSTTLDIDVAANFGYEKYLGPRRVTYGFDIRVREGTHYLPLDAVGMTERELVFAPGSAFRVTDVVREVTENGTMVKVKADLIPGVLP